MFSILIVNNNKEIDKSSIVNIIQNFQVRIVEASTLNIALELFNTRYFDIMFFDSSLEAANFIETYKNENSNLIIISVYNELIKQIKEDALSKGINDCISISADSDILKQRIANYINLAKLKREELLFSDSINLFNEEVNKHFLTFKIDTTKSQNEFTEYFSSSYFHKYSNIQESIDLLYAFSSWMCLNHRECEIIKETAEEMMYLTLMPIDFMSEDIITSLIQKHANKVDYKIGSYKLSLKLDSSSLQRVANNVSNLDDETKNILSKTHFNKITAIEYVESTPIELVNKLENLYEMEDRIDQAILQFEKNSNLETATFLSEEILQYIEVINMLVDFQHLAFSLRTLANAIKDLKQEQMKEKEIQKFTTLSLHLLNDLSTWRENIFVKQDANDIHYLDSSLLSSCLQLKAIFEEETTQEDEDDFELF